jgi:hypothetical protein
VTGNGTLGEKGTSSVALLVEALERALLLGRVNDAQRIVRRASEQIEQLVTTGGAVDAELLAALAGQAVELTAASHDPTWALWVLDVYTRTRQIPPIDVVERLVEVGRAAARRPTAAPGTIGHLFDRLGVGARALVQSEESDVPNEPGLGG